MAVIQIDPLKMLFSRKIFVHILEILKTLIWNNINNSGITIWIWHINRNDSHKPHTSHFWLKTRKKIFNLQQIQTTEQILFNFISLIIISTDPIKVLKQLHFQILLCERTGWSSKQRDYYLNTNSEIISVRGFKYLKWRL